MKKLGNIPDGGGWRYLGRQQGEKNRAATGGKPRSRHRDPLMGTAFVHTVIDDHSRVAYAEIHDDETAATATAVLRNAVTWFAARGVIVERVLRQRLGLPLPRLAGHLPRAGHQALPHSPLPAADERQDRTLPPHDGRRLGLPTTFHQ
ncbi:MAG: putative transposase [Modestobacter sp.]|nr:putative transposase [Modestobacter sp.]